MDRIIVIVQGVWTMEGLSYFEFGGSGTIQEIAIKKGNFELLTRIKDVDLFSKEAMYQAVAGNLLFGIFQLRGVLILWQLITRTK